MARYGDHPLSAVWETTQACDLACSHCRARATPSRDDAELSTDEARRLFAELAEASVERLVLTGGDPAKRPDLLELVAHGREAGLTVSLAPSPTSLMTRALLAELAAAGVNRLSVSVDGPSADYHDEMRGREGSFDDALRMLADAKAAEIPTQIDTTIHVGNLDRLSDMAELVHQVGAERWTVLFVVPTGRADSSMLPSADEVEIAMNRLAEIATEFPFAVKTSAAPFFRRVLIERQRDDDAAPGPAATRVDDGRGSLFISHRGDLFPSEHLPVRCGNVRRESLLEVYRSHPVFRALRDAEALEGKCGACEYRDVCGGSRARAYALTERITASDPMCAYEPPDYHQSSGRPRPTIQLETR